MANINSLPARFENGGIMEIGSDVVLHIIEGTLERVNPFTEKIPLKDRGVLQRPFEGDDAPGTLRFDVRYTSAYAASELEGIINTNGNNSTDAGRAPEKTITLKYPTWRGHTAGNQFQCTKCYVSSPARIQAGTDFDRLTVEFQCNEAWAKTTFSGA